MSSIVQLGLNKEELPMLNEVRVCQPLVMAQEFPHRLFSYEGALLCCKMGAIRNHDSIEPFKAI